MNNKPEEYLLFAEQLADRAGEVMRRYFNAEDIGAVAKDNDTPVTVADTMINQMVIDTVREVYPDHGVLGEGRKSSRDTFSHFALELLLYIKLTKLRFFSGI